MTLIARDISNEVIAVAKSYPVVTLIGPRQSGKTTITKMLFSDKPYVTLEDPDVRALAESDPRGFFAQFKTGAIIDEIQRLPMLLSYIQGIVDACDETGLFILTGSHQTSLQEGITQSLAGRTAILKLLPFSLNEINKMHPDFSYEDYLYTGMYPRIYMKNINPTKFYRDYVATYIERHVRQMSNIKNLGTFQYFLKLCATRIGQIFNAQNLSNELGVSHTTIKNWLSILESSFIIKTIYPYDEHFGKRIIKSPKIYFTDVGLATYLLEVTDTGQVSRHPLRGHLFENFIIMELIKNQLNLGLETKFYFYRDSNDIEIDCLYCKGNTIIPIEIKSASTFDKQFLKNLKTFMGISQNRCEKGFVIYNGAQEQDIHDVKLLNFRKLMQIFM